jgi:hypothetical protein
MSRRAAPFTQAEIARVLRAAKAEGATAVEIKLGETSIIVRFGPLASEEEPKADGEIIL